MGKRKAHSKRSLGSLPKGLPVRGGGSNAGVNPFEVTQKSKRRKFDVHNRGSTSQQLSINSRPSALALALQKRKTLLKESMQQSKKANVFTDRRIGEYDNKMTIEEQNLARLVRERTSRSKKISKYSLNDDDDDAQHELTHRGKSLNSMTSFDHVILSDDEDNENGNLDATDTLLHFGGGNLDKERRQKVKDTSMSMYGPSRTDKDGASNLLGQYGDPNRKLELEDLILRRKLMKAEKLKTKIEQKTKFEQLDESFSELANMLSFRNKEEEKCAEFERKKHLLDSKKNQTDSQNNNNVSDIDEWDKEMKQYLYNTTIKKAKATDRTKTHEEIAKEEFDRLHELETRRLARMNGDFDNDDFDDISSSSSEDEDDDDSDDQDKSVKKKKQTKKSKYNKNKIKKTSSDHPEALDNESDNDDESDDELKTKFTADGLVHIDKLGNVVGKVGEVPNKGKKNHKSKTIDEDDNRILSVGTKVNACYHAKEQYADKDSGAVAATALWYSGVIAQYNTEDGTYNIDYDDGDYEDNVERQHIQVLDKTDDEMEEELLKQSSDMAIKKKRQLAKEKARSEIPYVFAVPTTLDALHDVIGQFATTGEDVVLIIQRIHKANSVRLDKRNAEKMQNFHDVLLRRLIAVGDAIYNSGNGGNELGRYKQLDSLTITLYEMAQESPDCAASVWSRRLGFLHKAHGKRLRDSEFVRDDDNEEENDGNNFTAWPSTGAILFLRVLGHIFPVTDKKHPIVTPSILFLGQILTTTPIISKYDMVAGLMCCGILIEYTREAKRVVPEVNAFLASTIRLFSSNRNERTNLVHYTLPSLGAASNDDTFASLREEASKYKGSEDEGEEMTSPLLSLEKAKIQCENDTSAALLATALHFAEVIVQNLGGSLSSAEKEAFAEITESILCLEPKSKLYPLPKVLRSKAASVVTSLEAVCMFDKPRTPLQRRSAPSKRGVAIKSLAPRLENPEKFSLSKDKGKNASQSAADRTRREYKREHKAAARELRLDGAFIENERRSEEQKKADAARAKRHRAFAWLEGEQGIMNQQVRQGGGLLQGGGTGAAKAKARSGKLGIKKGGKF